MVWPIFGVEAYPWVTEYLKRPAFAFAVLVTGVACAHGVGASQKASTQRSYTSRFLDSVTSYESS